MKTIIEKQQKMLLIKFHTLCNRLELRLDEKAAIVEAYGCDSSKDLSAHELLDAVQKLEEQLQPQLTQMNVWRKRVLASIGGYLKQINYSHDLRAIKSIACRATGYDSFNSIPKERLVNIYNAFLKKQKDYKKVGQITEEMIDNLTILN